MRPIKYQAWDKKKKEMSWVLVIDWASEVIVTEKTGEEELEPNFDEYILLQFTGLKDKNGKEIYDQNWAKGVDPSGIERKGLIVMEESNTYFENEFIKVLLSDMRKLEVIGNRFENPELLKKEEIG